MENPCKGCSDRWVDISNCTRCHTTCEKYFNFQLDSLLNKGKSGSVIDDYERDKVTKNKLAKEANKKKSKYIKHHRKIV